MNCSPNKTPIEIIKEGGFGDRFMHYTCIAYITIDSSMHIDKKIICKFIEKIVDIG